MKKSQVTCGATTRKGQGGSAATPHRCGRLAGHKGQHICRICEAAAGYFAWNDKKDKPRYVVLVRCGRGKRFSTLVEARAHVRKATTILNAGDVYIVKAETGKRDVVVY